MAASRKTLVTFGSKGSSVRVLVHDASTVRVQWYEGQTGAKQRRSKDWPNTPEGRKEAKSWAKGFSEARHAPKAPLRLSVRELWERYGTAEFPALRQRSQAIYAEYWRYWERMWGRTFAAEDATLEMVDEFRAALRGRGLAVTTIGEAIRTVKRIYRWGHKRRLIKANPIGDYEYRIAKDERRDSPDEFSGDEFGRLLAQLDPTSATQWRAFVALAICGNQGVRQRAALHLAWTDIADDITWRKQWDKMGREWQQPIRAGTLLALAVAKQWRERSGYTGPWVIPQGSSKSNGDGTYSPQSLWAALKRAEKAAGIGHRAGRGAHGLRRLLAGEVNAATGDAVLAMHAIGDTDLRVMTRYLKRRDERIRGAFEKLDEAAASELQTNDNRSQTVNANAEPEGPASQGGETQ